MKFVSTRGEGESLRPSQALLKGLAPDGGLYIPESWPTRSGIDGWTQNSFPELAAKVLEIFFQEDPLQKSLLGICKAAFNFPLILKDLNESTSLLELFHGPTNAFKDFGARFLALTLTELRAHQKSKKNPLVLVATSGDTGGAVAAAFSECSDIPVCILYPRGKISKRQEKQLNSWPQNVRAFAVEGSFDDCQKLVKQAFLSAEWSSRFDLLSANSINLGRLLPQITYYADTSLKYFSQKKQKASFVIPSGNLGNGVAALWAQRLGFPIKKIILAHNANLAVPHFFATHQWTPRATVQTLANAMDVGQPSNFERLQKVYTEPPELFSRVQAFSVSDAEIRHEIKITFQNYSEMICPHTATAFAVQRRLAPEDLILVATAHPAKFEEVVEPLLQRSIPIPQNLAEILLRPSRHESLPAELQALQDIYF